MSNITSSWMIHDNPYLWAKAHYTSISPFLNLFVKILKNHQFKAYWQSCISGEKNLIRHFFFPKKISDMSRSVSSTILEGVWCLFMPLRQSVCLQNTKKSIRKKSPRVSAQDQCQIMSKSSEKPVTKFPSPQKNKF